MNQSEGFYIMTSASRTTACHDWCINEPTTLYQKVNAPKEPMHSSETDITENVVDYEDRNIPGSDISQFISTKYPAILEGDLDFYHLKGTDNKRERRTFCRKSVRALWEKLDNESWGGENFDHEQILKHMPRDKHLWAIDERDRQRDENTIVCDHCDLPGHRDDTCPAKTPVCYMCGLTDHIEPSCPRKNCLICGSPNQLHSSMCRDCYGWAALACSECGQRGHPSSHCPDLWRRYHSTIDNHAPLERCDQSKEQDRYGSIYPPPQRVPLCIDTKSPFNKMTSPTRKIMKKTQGRTQVFLSNVSNV